MIWFGIFVGSWKRKGSRGRGAKNSSEKHRGLGFHSMFDVGRSMFDVQRKRKGSRGRVKRNRFIGFIGLLELLGFIEFMELLELFES